MKCWDSGTIDEKIYLKTGTGYAWAGHSSVMNVFWGLASTFISSPDPNLGITLPTGSVWFKLL